MGQNGIRLQVVLNFFNNFKLTAYEKNCVCKKIIPLMLLNFLIAQLFGLHKVMGYDHRKVLLFVQARLLFQGLLHGGCMHSYDWMILGI